MKTTEWLLRIFYVILIGLALVAFASARAGDQPADRMQAPPEVTIDNFSFAPANLTVPAGTTVTWTNRDDVPHTVASEDGTFRSHALDTDEKFSCTFTKPGTYSYFCSVHPRMTAKVVVTHVGK